MTPMMPLTVLMVTLGALVDGDELRISCPAGTYVVVESASTVICRRGAPPTVTAAPGTTPTVIIQKAAPSTPAPTPAAGHGGMELTGLQSVPELCGLAVDHETQENTAEAVYLAVSACVEAVDVNPPTRPARWLPVAVEAQDKGHSVRLPLEPWAGTLQGCLLRKPPRLPRGAKGKSFTAWYLLTASPGDRPAPPSCLEGRLTPP